MGLISRSGRPPGGRNGNPLQYSCLEHPHGPRSLMGCSPRYQKESDITEQLSTHTYTHRSVARHKRCSSIPGLERSPGEGNGNLLQYSCLENPMDRGAWRATAPRIAQSWIWLKRLSTQCICSGHKLLIRCIISKYFLPICDLSFHFFMAPFETQMFLTLMNSIYILYPLFLCFCRHTWIFSPNLRPGEGNGTPLQYSCLENPMDGGAW